MINKLEHLKLYQKYKTPISYLIFSCLSAIIDAILGLLLVKMHFQVIAANIIGIVVSTVIHYVMTAKKTFAVSIGWLSMIIYIVTFAIGLFIQNSVLWSAYYYAFAGISAEIGFLISKAMSLVVSFFAMYFVRKKAYIYIK